ncbi:RagB/SusD family nutrient uptake outer membrane protein [Galbibacter pacificus]|uniref:RagB/SusD family nutrient uptake outer membrane protein n=1 Tax=Galbibacter pacificus TaxID=2996052 RepID=A0ABT6FN82_9FLAO|nr:RagB/SusD family nutrient uptake outer membrane protein [Galbibacter pacificus]MDG3581051.1 RagB/SusD family nutrient uptake outer membrane protein [Galbibacter pacificus]MDG3584529.1 RagB/SusD family nutrient uptake outer membrane protein [Galbibacter pacificus]
MKILYKYIVVVIGVLTVSCNDLDVDPLNIIQDKDIFNNENGVEAYFAGIYNTLPVEDFIYRQDAGFMRNDGGRWQCFYHPGALTGELVGPYGSTYDGAGGFGYWPYSDIRTVNYLIHNLPENAQNFTEKQIGEWLGEAYFCRAFLYFSLVKRYGGIPIIKDVQNYPEQSIEDLQVPRDKEIDVWNFIADDLDMAIDLMPESSDKGRANKYVAAALKSRAMLYAGTIAKYGSQNHVSGEARDLGLVGIPSAKAEDLFRQSLEASRILDGQYSLYKKRMDDKEQNYVDLFLDPESPESIWVKDYSLTSGSAHSWDATMTCRFMTADGLSRSYPTLETVERFGELDVVNDDGTPKRFDNLSDITEGIEPRLLASVYFPGSMLRDIEFDIQRGIYEQFSGTAEDEIGLNPPNEQYRHLAGSTDVLFEGKQVIGFTGISTNGDDKTRTGFYVRKYIDYNKEQSSCGLYQSTQSWIIIRYAEVLLNRAEAAYELGEVDEALNAINDIKDRAGAGIVSSGELTIDEIRNERNKELAFEKHYWWDLKRWAIADRVLDNTKFHGLLPYYILDEDKYIFLKDFETFQRTYTFEKKFYYEPIPGGELGKNPNLYPNNPNY